MATDKNDAETSKGQDGSKSTPSGPTVKHPTSLEKLLLAQTPKPDKSELNDDRVLVICRVADIDFYIHEMLKTLLVADSSDSGGLISDNQPIIDGLVKRAKLAKSVGLISDDLYLTIKDLADIRNDCAHERELFNVFKRDKVVSRTNKIYARLNQEFKDDDQKIGVKGKFIQCTGLLRIYLSHEINRLESISSHEKEILFG